MRPLDITECVDIIRADPVVGPRYAALISHLPSTFLGLLGRETFRAVVFEDLSKARRRLAGLGISVFITDDYACEIKTPPLSWVAPDLVRRVLAGEPPLLTDDEVRDANSSSGLYLYVWHGTVRPEDRARPDVMNCVLTAFIEQHRGFLLRELLCQAESPETAQMALTSGGLLWNTAAQAYDRGTPQCAQQLMEKPHVMGMTREHALSAIGSWVGSLFLYQPPQFGFRPSEQQLLTEALAGGTDEDLAAVLAISLSSVKKTWQAIYRRIGTVRAGSALVGPTGGIREGTRGRQKKQRLLAYLRDHPEELRPVSRRLLARQAR